ncbi:MAG: HAMP domain-containing protein, partial [Demequina sp.]|uniref:HAMP domain-containing protein n=1 Tax=Demequina sp. TaxID=2050685 RepID=UPI003A88B448
MDTITTADGAKRRLRINLSAQIFTAVGVALVALAIAGSLATVQLRSGEASTAELVGDQSQMSAAVLALQNDLWKARQAAGTVASYPVADRPEQQEKLEGDYATFEASLAAFAETYTETFGNVPDELAAVESQWAAYRDAMLNDFLPAALADDLDTLKAVREGTTREAGTNLVDSVAALTEGVDADLAAREDAAAQRSATTTTVVIALVIAGVVIAGAVALLVVRRIKASARAVSQSIEALAEGDLTVEAQVKSNDELGDMARSLSSAQGALRETMAEVVSSAQTVAAAAEELSAANAQVAAGSQETSAQAGVVANAADEVNRSVQAVASGAEQMGASIKEISHNANEAARVAAHATDVAESTNEQVSKLG